MIASLLVPAVQAMYEQHLSCIDVMLSLRV